MSEKSYILAPETLIVNIRMAPAIACLESLSLMGDMEEYPGLDEWIYQVGNQITSEQQHNNRMVSTWLGIALYHMEAGFASLPELLAEVERMDAVDLRDATVSQVVSHYNTKRKKMELPPLPDFTAADLLRDAETFVEYVNAIHVEGKEDSAFLREVFAMLNKPAAMKARILHHLHDMWESFMVAEWERVTPKLEATVAAFQKLDYSGMSPAEVTRTITGRDMTQTVLGDEMNTATELVFIPVPHIGPYVGMVTEERRTLVMFRPRLPEGLLIHSPELDRSELLVRLSALADDTRLRILELFTQYDELCAPQVIELLALSQSAASRHLRQLSATGYLTERRREGAKCYSLNGRRVDGTLQALQGFFYQGRNK